MAGNRRAARTGALYAAITSAGTAEPVFFVKSWNIEFSTDQIDVTSFADSNKTFVVGLPNGKGSFAGFWSDDSNDLYNASLDGLARKFYLYPDRVNKPNTYWYGLGFFDFSASGDVSGAVEVTGNIVAQGAWTRNAA
jgi:hypothetical protein